jgi:hypothetical protein
MSEAQKSTKSFVVLLILTIIFGYVGIHRFYAGGKKNVIIGVTYLIGFIVIVSVSVILTFCVIGIFGFFIPLIWYVIELILLLMGKIKDDKRTPITTATSA